jgi:hypothetical protein
MQKIIKIRQAVSKINTSPSLPPPEVRTVTSYRTWLTS